MQFYHSNPGVVEFRFEDWEWKIPSQNGKKSAVHDFLDAFKARVPFPDRDWNDQDKIWIVLEKHLETIRELQREYLRDKNQLEIPL